MSSIGDTLRHERQRRNLELSKIANELKISTRFLDAMEQDEFGKLPGGVFTKSFVRQYATLLGLDAEELVAAVRQVIEPTPEVPEAPTPPKPDVKGVEVEMLEENWQSVRDRRNPLPSWVRAGVLLVALMIVCSGVYYWSEQRAHRSVVAHQVATPPSIPVTPSAAPAPVENPPAPSIAPAPVPTAAPAAVPAQGSATRSAGELVDQPAPIPSAAGATPPATPPNPNAKVRVSITADEEVWISATVNGKVEFSGTLQPHESRNIDADGEVDVRLGNAGGVTLTLNGKPVGAVGPKGQVRIVQFTSGGFQIVSAPMLDPLDRL
jgi:cytoskeleton protein RodZ